MWVWILFAMCEDLLPHLMKERNICIEAIKTVGELLGNPQIGPGKETGALVVNHILPAIAVAARMVPDLHLPLAGETRLLARDVKYCQTFFADFFHS